MQKVFVSKWGYDQTNVDFFRVTKETEFSLWLEPLGQVVVKDGGFLSEYVAPSDAVAGKVFRRKKSTYSDETYVKVNDYAVATEWSGEPVLQTHTH